MRSYDGVGGAVVRGVQRALEHDVDVVVKCDGDGQMDPAEIPLLVAPIAAGVADHVKGSRFYHVLELRSMPRLRLLGNIILTFLVKLASGYWNIDDPANGFFATRVVTLRQLPLSRLATRYIFESDLLIRLNIVEARVIDVPLPARYADEKSSLSLLRSAFEFQPRLARGLVLRVFWRYLFYDVSPVAIFGLAGMLLMLFGAAFGAYQWAWHVAHQVATPIGTVMIATLPLVFGFQLLLEAVVLDIYNTPRPGSQRRDEERRRDIRRGRPKF